MRREAMRHGMKRHETSGKFCLLAACFVKNLLRVLHFVPYKSSIRWRNE